MKSTPKPDGKIRVDGKTQKSRLNTPMFNLLIDYSIAYKYADGNKN